eukprot:ctg_174.g112
MLRRAASREPPAQHRGVAPATARSGDSGARHPWRGPDARGDAGAHRRQHVGLVGLVRIAQAKSAPIPRAGREERGTHRRVFGTRRGAPGDTRPDGQRSAAEIPHRTERLDPAASPQWPTDRLHGHVEQHEPPHAARRALLLGASATVDREPSAARRGTAAATRVGAGAAAGSTGEWYLPRDGRPPQPRAVRVWRVNNESTAQLMVWTTTSMQIRYQPPAWITPQLSGKLRARGEIRVHAGSCWHQLRNLTLAVGASHNASAACHANVRLLIDYFDETMGNAASMWAGAPLAVVRPFTLAQLSAVESSLELWGRPWACPCTNATTSRPVDLIYYFNGDDASGAELLARLSRRGIPACFRHVQLVAANVPSHEDRHPDGTCFQFYAMFCDPLFMERYAHAFVMEPDVTPLRPGWLDAVLKHARSSDAWMQGSSSRCHGQYAFNDLHLNGNAIYALRSRNFRRFLERVQRRFPPAGHVRFAPGCSGGRGGFDHSLHQLAVEEALAEPTHWRGTWRRRFVGDHTPVVNYCKQAYRPWEVLLEADNEHAYLVHSQWGVQRDVWDPAAYAMRFPDEAVVAFLRKWSAEPFPLPSSFRRFIRQGRHR